MLQKKNKYKPINRKKGIWKTHHIISHNKYQYLKSISINQYLYIIPVNWTYHKNCLIYQITKMVWVGQKRPRFQSIQNLDTRITHISSRKPDLKWNTQLRIVTWSIKKGKRGKPKWAYLKLITEILYKLIN